MYCVHDFVYWQQEQSSSGVNKRCRVNNFMILSVVVTISMSDINGFHKTHWFMPLLLKAIKIFAESARVCETRVAPGF